MSDEISHYRSWKDARVRMDPKQFARELLTEENYLRYLKSCEFTTKGLFIGFLAGFLVPVIVLFIMTGDVSIAALFGVSFGVIWMLIWGLFWLIVCRIAPQGKIHREFGKWYKNPGATIGDLDVIFYKDDNTTLTAPEFDISSVGSHELSEKEKKRVRRYGLFLPLVRPFILMTFLNAGVWLLLSFINGFVFHDILSDLDLALLLLAIEIIYMIAFCICSLAPHFGMNGVKWGKIALKADVSAYKKNYSAQQSAVFGARAVGDLLGRSDDARVQKVGKAANALAAVGAAGVVAGVTNDNLREVRLVADACGVKLPETKKYVRFIVIFPILLLIAAYVPQFISAKQTMDTQVAMASESVYALQSAFEDGCDSVSIYDPQERYNANGYHVSGRIYRDFYESVSSEVEAYIYITVDNDGLIAEVDYCAYIDVQAAKEENLAMIESDFRELNRMLNASGVEAVSDDLMDICELPEEFVTRFLENSYYEYFSVDEGESITVSYITDTEEDYDEHSDSYVYLSIKSDN